MKLTRLKSERPRRAHDFYPTPYGLAKTAIEYIGNLYSPPHIVLDPGCGDGIWGRAVSSLYSSYVIGVDVNIPKNLYQSNNGIFYNEDYLQWKPKMNEIPDWIIGNPPYSLMEEFVRRSFAFFPLAKVLFLGRLEFLGSKKRADGLFKEYPLSFVLVLPRRPSFFSTNGHRTTDAMEYALYFWNGSRSFRSQTTLSWLNWEYDKEND